MTIRFHLAFIITIVSQLKIDSLILLFYHFPSDTPSIMSALIGMPSPPNLVFHFRALFLLLGLLANRIKRKREKEKKVQTFFQKHGRSDSD